MSLPSNDGPVIWVLGIIVVGLLLAEMAWITLPCLKEAC